ncbi:MAG: hypothetical protein Kow0025_08360 [Thermodesulfovibrionales bacterium]
MKRLRIAAAAAPLLGFILGGCAAAPTGGKTMVQEDAFGSRKMLAVVTIASVRQIQGEKDFARMFKRSDNMPGAHTQPIINHLGPKMIKALAQSRHFVLLPENRVLRNKSYKALEEDRRADWSLFKAEPITVARRYKYFSDPRKFAQLAEALHADGVISVLMSFTIQSEKAFPGGDSPPPAMKDYAMVLVLTAQAYDRTGAVIWRDTVVEETDLGGMKAIIPEDLSDMRNTDLADLRPLAVEAGERAIQALVGRFRDAVEGPAATAQDAR